MPLVLSQKDPSYITCSNMVISTQGSFNLRILIFDSLVFCYLAKNLLWIAGSKCESKGGRSYLVKACDSHTLSDQTKRPGNWYDQGYFQKANKALFIINSMRKINYPHAFFCLVSFFLIALTLRSSDLCDYRSHPFSF